MVADRVRISKISTTARAQAGLRHLGLLAEAICARMSR